jgi:transcription termination/antitermination protein NusA
MGKQANVLVPADEVSKAIGKGGVNIRLASKLAECEIDVYREVEEEDDIDLAEFEVDFGKETIDLLMKLAATAPALYWSLMKMRLYAEPKAKSHRKKLRKSSISSLMNLRTNKIDRNFQPMQ